MMLTTQIYRNDMPCGHLKEAFGVINKGELLGCSTITSIETSEE